MATKPMEAGLRAYYVTGEGVCVAKITPGKGRKKMRAYFELAGGHYHMSFFHNGKMGDLVCGEAEFPALRAAMSGIEWIDRVENERMSGFKGPCRGGPWDGEELQSSKQTFPVTVTRDIDGRYEFSLRTREWNWSGPDVPKEETPDDTGPEAA